MSGKYAVRGYPTVVFADPDGKEIGRLAQRDPASVLAKIEEAATKHPGKK